jgi:hypothetical protein
LEGLRFSSRRLLLFDKLLQSVAAQYAIAIFLVSLSQAIAHAQKPQRLVIVPIEPLQRTQIVYRAKPESLAPREIGFDERRRARHFRVSAVVAAA